MKTQVIIATAALTIAATMDSVSGLAKYLNEIPNGSLFQQSLGHIGGDSSKTTPFAEAFAAADHTWSSSLCEAKFPGSSMTNGAAFGDPCCTWKKGGKPDFTVTAFTTTPGKATTCASKASDASTGTTTGGSPSGAGDATKGSPWGSSTTPTSGGGCAAKRTLRR
ncbi:Temptin [Phytophthora nicotianae]|uniref:Temptin n=1 Tax=Phytophthora nicotianae TaxID=4792 RepID=A0A0W8CNH2_PHYNI|nr:Temptin [Phytophthora nicotianae]